MTNPSDARAPAEAIRRAVDALLERFPEFNAAARRRTHGRSGHHSAPAAEPDAPAETSTSESFEAALRAFREAPWEVRLKAVRQAASRKFPSVALRILEDRIREDPEWRVREAAVEALAGIGQFGEQCEALLRFVVARDPHPRPVEAALRLIKESAQLASRPKPIRVLGVVRAQGRRTQVPRARPTRPDLEALLDEASCYHPDPSVREAALVLFHSVVR